MVALAKYTTPTVPVEHSITHTSGDSGALVGGHSCSWVGFRTRRLAFALLTVYCLLLTAGYCYLLQERAKDLPVFATDFSAVCEAPILTMEHNSSRRPFREQPSSTHPRLPGTTGCHYPEVCRQNAATAWWIARRLAFVVCYGAPRFPQALKLSREHLGVLSCVG